MQITTPNETLVEVDGRARAELGPVLVAGIADEATLSDEVTAAHYRVGKLDALGNVIVADQPFTYLDWKHRDTFVWHLYLLEEGSWVKKGEAAGDQAAAKDVAVALLQS